MTSTAEQMRAWTGPAFLTYGFRPFFLGASVWAAFAMALWVPMLSGLIVLPTAFDPVSWHAHEFLFGYLGAVVAGFLLTAVPNWTGRLPIVGWRSARSRRSGSQGASRWRRRRRCLPPPSRPSTSPSPSRSPPPSGARSWQGGTGATSSCSECSRSSPWATASSTGRPRAGTTRRKATASGWRSARGS